MAELGKIKWYVCWSATDLWVSENGESDVGSNVVLWTNDEGELCFEIRDRGTSLMFDLDADHARSLTEALTKVIGGGRRKVGEDG